MHPNLTTTPTYRKAKSMLAEAGIAVVSEDTERPWGGFLVIDPEDTDSFIETFFAGTDITVQRMHQFPLQPKILIVAPHKRLSWQYHHRRAEVWRVLQGPVAVELSATDEETEPQTYQNDDVITIKQGQRHRLIGMDASGIVAEIWQHTHPDAPSDEDDIVRVQDDTGRR
jgi:mannose-6-phosphate isomerase-like protein (cupin superfamily)